MYPLIHVFGRMQGNYNLKEIAIAHSITARNNQKCKRAALQWEFCNLQSQADLKNADHCRRLLEIKDLLRAIDDEGIEGTILHSEELTQYFYQLKNSCQSCDMIHELHIDGNTTVKTSQGILKECNAF